MDGLKDKIISFGWKKKYFVGWVKEEDGETFTVGNIIYKKELTDPKPEIFEPAYAQG